MQFNIFKGDRPSNGAINLKDALGATMLKSKGSAYTGRRESCIINWGCTNAEAHRLFGVAQRAGRKMYNDPAAVEQAVDKLNFHQVMFQNAPDITIPFVTSFQDAVDMVHVAGARVYARTVLNGHSGKGIALLVSQRDASLVAIKKAEASGLIPVYVIGEDDIPQEVMNTKLFTQGISANRIEYRIHVVNGKVVLVQQKRRAAGWGENEKYNSVVRNVESGWIYAVNDVDAVGLEASKEAAIDAINACSLDFGAVDIVYQQGTSRAYVLEVNTAPGLDEDGSALAAYTEAFKNV